MNPILKRTLTGLAVGAGVICAILLLPVDVFPWAVGVLIALALCEYVFLLKTKVPLLSAKGIVMLALGAYVIAFGLWSLSRIAVSYGNLMLLYVVAVVKFSDVGGFAFGLTSAKLMKGGNHKLCPTISPNKSWEGLAGSVFASCLVSCCFMGGTHFGIVKSLVCGVTAALVGTFGDLVESKFKRWVGVKDSSTMKITNGMGGFLDMFDSLLFAPAVIYILMGIKF